MEREVAFYNLKMIIVTHMNILKILKNIKNHSEKDGLDITKKTIVLKEMII
ncbi:hypothetical protein KLEB273_gp213 [Bacillus phage vB_BauM_KLEB27-3]|nr:hypothetical protein KLEB273_gp213 [Bacillus phage vB_BauM_KLEB27-3]